jgi:Putative MetA-pathway of phenol degradation
MPELFIAEGKSTIWRFARIALLLGAFSRVAVADDSTSAPAAATEPPDKWQYTLFNPTPTNLMRDMDTDRPDKTDSPLTIDAGHLQIEIGVFDYDYYHDQYQGADARIDALSLGQFNFRLGVLNDLELNVIVNSWNYLQVNDHVAKQSTYQNGFGDTVVGGTFNFWGNELGDDTWDTAFGIEPQFKIPTAREEIGNGHPEWFVGFPFVINLPADFHLSVETTISDERNLENTGYVAGWQNSASVDRVFFGKFDIYLEYWADVSTESHEETEQTLDVGFTYPLTDNIVVDTGLNFGLNKASDTFEATSGISVRF